MIACVRQSSIICGSAIIWKRMFVDHTIILGLQPIPGDPKDNGVAAMLDDRTFCFVIQHGRHAIMIVFLDLQGLVANQ